MWSDGLVCFFDFSKWHDFYVSGFVLFHLAALSYIIVLLACKYYGQPPAKFRWGQSNVNKCVCTNDVSKQSHLLWCFLPLFLLPWDCKSSVEPAVVLHSLEFSLTACLGLFFLFFFCFPHYLVLNLSSEMRIMDQDHLWGASHICPCFCPCPRVAACNLTQHKVNTGVRCSAGPRRAEGEQSSWGAAAICAGLWHRGVAVLLADPLCSVPAGLSPRAAVPCSRGCQQHRALAEVLLCQGPRCCSHQTLWVKAFALEGCTWTSFYPWMWSLGFHSLLLYHCAAPNLQDILATHWTHPMGFLLQTQENRWVFPACSLLPLLWSLLMLYTEHRPCLLPCIQSLPVSHPSFVSPSAQILL